MPGGSSCGSPSTSSSTGRPGLAHRADQDVDRAHRRLRRELGHRPLLAQQADEPPHLGERLASGRLDRLEGLPLALLLGAQQPPDRSCLHGHHGDRVRDDVVELARDPLPLLGDRAFRGSRTLGLESARRAGSTLGCEDGLRIPRADGSPNTG